MGALILIVAGVFLLCYLVDKGFTKLFRGTVQHQSGKSVRLSKRYGSIGAIIAFLIWLNWSLTALLTGAVFNQALREAKKDPV